MAITTRFGQPLNSNVLSWSQFRDTLAVVVVKDHALSFDLGARDCPFGQLAPWHQNVGGVTCDPSLKSCVPKTCADLGNPCGAAGDGCGGMTPVCSTCTSPAFCGGGGPNKCGGNNGLNPDGGIQCTPKTCAAPVRRRGTWPTWPAAVPMPTSRPA